MALPTFLQLCPWSILVQMSMMDSAWVKLFPDAIVGGRNPANQLRLVVYPIIYIQGFLHTRWCRISSINSIELFPHVINKLFLGVALGDPPLSVTTRLSGFPLPLHLLMQKMLQSNWYQHNCETGFCFWYNVVGVGRHSVFHIYLTTKRCFYYMYVILYIYTYIWVLGKQNGFLSPPAD